MILDRRRREARNCTLQDSDQNRRDEKNKGVVKRKIGNNDELNLYFNKNEKDKKKMDDRVFLVIFFSFLKKN